MDIEFPPWLEFLRDLCPQWPDPPASETAMRDIARILRDTAGWYRDDLIPELAGVPTHTGAVLSGDTADAFTQQFAKLLNGQYSVHRDVDALEALADLADTHATEIQYFKLEAISTLAFTATMIAVALFNADWSLGASLAEIPIAELLAENTIRELAEMVFERIAAALASTLSRTALARMLIEGAVGAGIGAGQELLVQAIQVREGWRSGINLGQVGKSALTMGVSGAAAGVVGHDLSELLGQDGTLPVRFLKGAVTGAVSGVAANAAGNLVNRSDVGANTLLGAAMGFAGGFSPGHAETATSAFDAETADRAVPVNAIDTHPTLRFEKQPDGTFAWPGETANGTEPQAHTASAPAPTTEPPVAGVSSAPAHALPAAGDPGARSVEATTTTPPAAADTVHLLATSFAAGLDAAPAAHASVGSQLSEGTLDLSTASPAAHTATASAAVSSLPAPSNVASPASSAAPTMPTAAGPSSPAPTLPSAAGPPPAAPTSPPAPPGPNAGLSSPTPSPHAGPAEISPAAKPSPELAGAPAGGRVDTTATPDAGTHDNPAEHAAPAQPVGVDPAASAGRSGADAHPLSRGEGTRVHRERAIDPLITRRDPARPESSRDDSNRPGGARPAKPARQSGVARDIPQDLQPAVATRAPDLIAAAQEIRVIKAHHDDNGPGPGESDSYQGGRFGGYDHNTPDPDTAGGGAGDYRGGSGHRGGAGSHGGGAGTAEGVAGHDDGGDGHNAAERGAAGGAAGDTAADTTAVGGSGENSPPLQPRPAPHQSITDQPPPADDNRVQAQPDEGGSSDPDRSGSGAGVSAGPHADADAARPVSDAALAQRPAKAIRDAEAYHEASDRRYRADLARRDELKVRQHDGVRLNRAERAHIRRMDGVEAAWRSVGEAARQAGVSARWWEYEPDAFGGAGIAKAYFGDTPLLAKKVAWYVPGMLNAFRIRSWIDDFDVLMEPVVNVWMSAHREDPNLSVSAIAWLGYETPRRADGRVAGHTLARAGAENLRRDVSDLDATRAHLGASPAEHHVIGHSYGAATVGYAGFGGRLGPDTRFALVGPAGVGPITCARDFGSDHPVLVLASSRDFVTALGGRTDGSLGRVLGRGLGIDPAMQGGGFLRGRAEFPAESDHLDRGSRATHMLYFSYHDPRAERLVRSESLANLGAWLADCPERIQIEPHRTLVRARSSGIPVLRTRDPAAERHVLWHTDDPNSSYPTGPRHWWDPRWAARAASSRRPSR
jgi:hypothetical protein